MESELIMTARGYNHSSYFSLKESKILAEYILQRISVIESKETSAIMWMRKEQTWEEITEAFNSITKKNRSVITLKTQYNVINRIIKRKTVLMKKTYSSQEEALRRYIFFGGNAYSELITTTPRNGNVDYGYKPYPSEMMSSEGNSEYDCDEGAREEVESVSSSEDRTNEPSRDLTEVQTRLEENDCDEEEVESVCSSEDMTVEPSRDSIEVQTRLAEYDCDEEEVVSVCSSEDMAIEPSRDLTEVQTRLEAYDCDEAVNEEVQLLGSSEDLTIEPSRDLIEVQTRLAERELEKIALEQYYMQRKGELESTKISLEIENLRQEEARKKELHELQMRYLVQRYLSM